jgi:hypothetical protein
MANKALTDYQEYLANASKRSFARAERFEVHFNINNLIAANDRHGGTLKRNMNPDAEVMSWRKDVVSSQNAGLLEGDVALFCEEVQIPGLILSNKEFNIGPWTFFRNTKVGFLGNEINFTFVTDNEWKLRSFFEQWMKECADTTSQELGYIDAVTTTMTINALDLQDNIVKSWTLHEAMPKVLNLVPLSSGTTSAIRNTLIVSAAYWESSDSPGGKGLKSYEN